MTIQVRLRSTEQDVMGTIAGRLAAADVGDAVVRVDVQAPAELAGDVDRIRIRNSLRQAGAHVVSGVTVQIDAPDRTRTRLDRSTAIESLEPEQAINLYMEKSSVATERRAVLLQAAREIINADRMGQGLLDGH